MRNYIFTLFMAFVGLSCQNNTNAQTNEYLLQDVFSPLTFENPVEFVPASGNSNRFFVAEQRGRIKIINPSNLTESKIFLNIINRVTFGGERGLLGLTFHPNYENNGYFYVNYTRTQNGQLQTVVSRFQVSANNPDSAVASSELILMAFNQPFSNHNAGKVAFGNDGYLYISSGDGGSGGDPQNNAQNRSNLLGKVLRINVNSTQGTLPYAIPADNPYKGNNQGFREEIYAYGLRNTWKFSFDKLNYKIWGADVGQNAREEINIIEKGKNYGWRIMEGTACYNPSQNCNTSNLIYPIWDYEQSNGDRSITGGYVYRGTAIPHLVGKYIYGDYVSGKIWALTYNENTSTATNQQIMTDAGNISSFGQDKAGELYVLQYGSQGKIRKLIPVPNSIQASRLVKNDVSFSVFPNPSSEKKVLFEFELPENATVTLSIFSTDGKTIDVIQPMLYKKGKHQIQYNTQRLSAGMYVCTLQIGENTAKRTNLIVKK